MILVWRFQLEKVVVVVVVVDSHAQFEKCAAQVWPPVGCAAANKPKHSSRSIRLVSRAPSANDIDPKNEPPLNAAAQYCFSPHRRRIMQSTKCSDGSRSTHTCCILIFWLKFTPSLAMDLIGSSCATRVPASEKLLCCAPTKVDLSRQCGATMLKLKPASSGQSATR